MSRQQLRPWATPCHRCYSTGTELITTWRGGRRVEVGRACNHGRGNQPNLFTASDSGINELERSGSKSATSAADLSYDADARV
jgi:hypothetical protein